MLLGCLVALLASAGAAAVFVLEEVHTLRDALNQNAALKISPGALAAAGWGAPQTLLLVGNDERKHTTTTPVLPHSNEMLLVRLDPSKPWISMMSLPRELMVPIHTPGGVVDTRLNAALTYGGIPLLVRTIKQVTHVSVNHVVEIDFNSFVRAVNNIGCVYSTVDRRYYHVNVPGGPQYFQVNLQPGYQRMCGQQALQFVSYRHGDTSLVRDARDQAFLLDVKREYGPTLVNNAHKFEEIFGRTVQTDAGLHNTNGILNLLGTLVSSVNKPVRQVQFRVNLEPTGANPCSCDTATPKQIAASVHSFLHGANRPPKSRTAAVARSVRGRRVLGRLPLVAVPRSELAGAHATAVHVPFPFEYPGVQEKGGSGVPVDLRSYVLRAPGGARYPAYVAVFSAGQLGQFYDVQGSPWTTQPQLDSPDQTVSAGGRTYYLYYSGQHLRIVAWYVHNDVYWIHNSLTDAVGNGELLAIAEQTVPITGSHALAARAQVSLRAAKIPLRLSTTNPVSVRQQIGSILSLVAVVLLVPLLGLLVWRWRDLRRARQTIAASLDSSSHLARVGRPLLAAGGASAYPPSAGGARGFGLFLRAPGGGLTARAGGLQARVLRLPVILSGLLMLVAGAALGVVLTFAGARVVHATTHHRAAHWAPGTGPPSVPVEVLNSTAVNGAAARLSRTLHSHGVKVGGVGNVTGPRPAGLQILYVPGERSQAHRLAILLAGQHPTVAPIDPAAAGAAGKGARLVVVIG